MSRDLEGVRLCLGSGSWVGGEVVIEFVFGVLGFVVV